MTTLAAGNLAATAFVSGAAGHHGGASVIYNGTNGQLLYDADGNGAGAAVLVATLNTGLVMTAASSWDLRQNMSQREAGEGWASGPSPPPLALTKAFLPVRLRPFFRCFRGLCGRG